MTNPYRRVPVSIRYLLSICAFLLLLPSGLQAASFQLESETLLRFFQRDTSEGNDQQVIPAYEFLRLDADNLLPDRLSFHGYGWGRFDTTDSGFYDDATGGELIYAYLEYLQPDSNFMARLGRQQIFEGVTNDAVDGLYLTSDFARQFSASLYGGQPVGLSTTDSRGGDSIYGARIAHRYRSISTVGVSYKTIDNDSATAENLAGLDFSVNLPKEIMLSGYTNHNLDSGGLGEQLLEASFDVGNFHFRPYVEYYNYDDYFQAGANGSGPFPVLANSGEELFIQGLDTTWRRAEDWWRQPSSWELGGKIKLTSYDQNDASQYLSGLATWHGDDLTQAGGELGYMNGEAAANNYLLARLFGYLDQLPDRYWVDFASCDLLYALYDKDIHGTGYALFLSLGAGKKFLDDSLELKLSGDYSQDPFYDDDLKAQLSASYLFDASKATAKGRTKRQPVAKPATPAVAPPATATKLAQSKAPPLPESPAAFLQRWAAAWSARDVDVYLNFYADNYDPGGGFSRSDWERLRRSRLTRPETIEVKLEEISIVSQTSDLVQVQLLQHYNNDNYRDSTRKVFDLRLQGDSWAIVKEGILH